MKHSGSSACQTLDRFVAVSPGSSYRPLVPGLDSVRPSERQDSSRNMKPKCGLEVSPGGRRQRRVANCDVHAWVITEALSYQGELFHSLEHKNIPGTVVASRPRRSGER